MGLLAFVASWSCYGAPGNAGDILEHVRAATGGAAWDKVKALHVDLKRQSGDATADAEEWLDPAQGRAMISIAEGPDAGRIGFDGKTTWAADPDGAARVVTGRERSDILDELYWRTQGWTRSGRAGAVWKREEKLGGRLNDVLEVTPVGSAPLELWVDQPSHLPTRVILPHGAATRTVRLSAWRRFEGINLPQHREIEDGKSGDRLSETVSNAEVNPAAAAARFAMPTGRAVDYVLLANADSVALPMRVLNDHIFVQVSSAKTRLSAMFDSGSDTVIDPAALQRLNLPASSQISTTAAPSVRLPDLAMGGVSFRHPRVAVRDLSAQRAAEGVPLDLVLGYELPTRLVVELDYEARRMVLIKPDRFVPPPTAAPLAIRMAGHLPVSGGRIDGVSASLSLETGRWIGLTVGEALAQPQLASGRWHPAPVILGSPDDTAAGASLLRAASLELGVLALAQPLVAVSPASLPADGAVGGGILRRFDVVLDYPHGKIWLQPNKASSQIGQFDHCGLWLTSDGTAFRIAALLPDGPGQRAGLRVGDLIERLDGEATSSLRLPEARLRLEGPPGSGVTLQVRRGDETRSARIILADPLSAPQSATR